VIISKHHENSQIGYNVLFYFQPIHLTFYDLEEANPKSGTLKCFQIGAFFTMENRYELL
jgi:hypothetical protein